MPQSMLLAGSMQSRASWGGFHREPEQAGIVEPVHGGPAV
jgi:hypothetical protein